MRPWLYLKFVILAACSRTKITTKEPDGKIVGGTPVSLQKYPSACLFFNVGAQCAGSIINSFTILTAAHCFDNNKDRNQMFLELESRYLYDFNAKQYDVRSFVIHEKYNHSAKFECDIALIFVKKFIKFGPKAQKAPIVNHNKWMSRREKKFVVTGWGWTTYGGPLTDKGLMMTEMHFVPSKDCGRMHNLTLTPDMFCLYGNADRDTCKGDSGGGVLWNNMLVGITSHGNGCAQLNKPSVYANVWYFRRWIQYQIDRFIQRYCDRNGKRK